jgi:hypothetical protein
MRAWRYCSVFPHGGEGLDVPFSLYRPKLLCFTREPAQAISTAYAPENDNDQLQEIHLYSLPPCVENALLPTLQLPDGVAWGRVVLEEEVVPWREVIRP